MTTTADNPSGGRPTEPDLCGQQLRADPSKVCAARRVDDSDHCLAHHPNRRDLIEQILTSDERPTLDFSNSEVDHNLFKELVDLRAIGYDSPPERPVHITFRKSIVSVTLHHMHFSGPVDFDETLGQYYLHNVEFASRVTFCSARLTMAHFENVQFSDFADFERATFISGAWFSNVLFTSAADFSYTASNTSTHFRHVQFSGYADFSFATFLEEVFFSSCKFNRDVLLAGTAFEDAVGFKDVEFSEQLSFAGNSFKKYLSFLRVRLAQSIELDGLTIPGNFKLRFVQIGGSATFRNTNFLGAVVINDVQFGEAVSFADVQFSGDLSFASVTFSGAFDFARATIEAACIFYDVTFASVANFSGAIRSQPIELLQCNSSMTWLIVVGDVPVQLNRLMTTYPLTIETYLGENASEFSAASISILRSTFVQPVTISANTILTGSSFRHSTGLDRLRFQGDPKWPIHRGRTVISDEIDELSDISSRELELLYRQLRAGLEASKAAPAAADFFYGEMEARRTHTRRQSSSARLERLWSIRYTSLRWWLLSFYKWFAGYGVRASRALTSYFASVVVIGLSFFWFDAQLVESGAQAAHEIESFWKAMAFSLRNSIYLFSAPDIDLQPWGIMVLALGRLAGVAFLALAVIGLRSHTER